MREAPGLASGGFLRYTWGTILPMGKPKCTQELIAEAVELKSGGMSNRDMCAVLGISESTFYKWLSDPRSKNQSELSEALKRAEGEFYRALRDRIVSASEHDWKAAAWMLERTRPDEFGRDRHLRPQKGDQAPTVVLGVEAVRLDG